MSERWEQVKEILALALERSPAERGGFVREACGDDSALRDEVESLIAHSSGADSLLEDSPVAHFLSFQPEAMVGKKVGAYRIIRAIGHGGMAVVYLGERDDQHFRKQVAIKMVLPGTNAQEIFRRFRNERQTLASLDHPNIVKLIDGGSTEEGVPYLVMDYVDGVPIDQHCEIHTLSIDLRLRLFCTVCSAVEYANGKHVIHRDLKPANILITRDGVPRLLDFGIAKLLDPDLFHTRMATQTSWRPMTPEYASPEQVRGQEVTKSTDIYSLGVMLYELLTDHRPYRATSQSLLEMERSICEDEAEKPSTVVGRTESRVSSSTHTTTVITPEQVARNRGMESIELRRRLQGDLDTILMKALRKDPRERYASALDFSEDIERHLAGRPVAARRPTFSYRGGRFLRRHKESAGTAIILLMLAAAVGTWEARHLWTHDAGAETATAPAGARRSVAVLGFKNLSARADTAWVSTALSEMLATELGAGEQLRTISGETVARMKTDLGLPDMDSLAPDSIQRVRRELNADYVVLGSYLDLGKDSGNQIRLDLHMQVAATGETIATVSESSGEEQLLDLITRCGRQLREKLGVAEVRDLQSAGVRASVSSSPEAMRLYSEGLAKLRTFDSLGAKDALERAVNADPSYPLAHVALAQAWTTLGYNENAVAEAKRALDLGAALSREDHALVEAHYYEASKDWDKAIQSYQTLYASFPDNLEYGLDLVNAQLGGERANDALSLLAKLRETSPEAKNDPRIDLSEAQAANLLSDNKRMIAAGDAAVKKSEASGARLLTARASLFQCRGYANLGEAQQAEIACDRARRVYDDSGDLSGEAQALHAAAEAPLDQGNLSKAQALYQQALALSRVTGDKRAIARELGNLAVVAVQEGDPVSAEKLDSEALQDYGDVGDKQGMAVVEANTGDLFHLEGRLDKAVTDYRDALVLAREVGHKSAEAIDLQLIGSVLMEQGELNDAAQMFQQAATIQQQTANDGYYADTLISMGELHRQRGDSDGAKKLFDEALSLRLHRGEAGSVAEAQLPLAELACDSNQGATAEKLAQGAAEEFEKEKESDAQILALALLSRALLEQGKSDGAQSAVSQAKLLSARSSDVAVRLVFEIDSANVLAAAGDLGGAEREAKSAAAEAHKLGFVQTEMEASLALGEIQLKASNPAAGRAELQQVAKVAHARGFILLERKASAAEANLKTVWRRGWDSNPRLSFPNTRFRGELLQPLGHLSAS
jgi:serine/threonine protein kinase/tetratricopeptide (TPR) repeat protein